VKILPELVSKLGKSKVIEVLSELEKGDKSQIDIMHDLRIAPSTAGRALRILVELGLIKKYLCEKTRSENCYSITPLGRMILNELKKIERIYLEGVSEDEKFEMEAEGYFYRGDKDYDTD